MAPGINLANTNRQKKRLWKSKQRNNLTPLLVSLVFCLGQKRISGILRNDKGVSFT